MTTPREIPASDVVRGMRVRVAQYFGGQHGSTVETIEGDVIACENANITFANGAQRFLGYDHPVTVLADPEPEWVEGAWYWVEDSGPMIRRGKGWYGDPSDKSDFPDLEDGEAKAADVRRVLIVDWPGDEWAADLDKCNDETRRAHLTMYGARDGHDAILRKVADAIRAQGGVQ